LKEIFLEDLLRTANLLSVEKPARYMGGEMGAISKAQAEVRFFLAFPDVYEVGMSHLGLQILYAVLNAVPWIGAERVYAPWPDMEEMLRQDRTPLTTLESSSSLAQADILGFTLQYELSYSNVLNMLELAGIPLLAAERTERDPLVLGGGPCAFNPEPLADFFDAFLIGDGEEAVLEVAEACRAWKQSGEGRQELLERLTAIAGVYVPSFFQPAYDDAGHITAMTPLKSGYTKVRRRFVSDLNETLYPIAPVVPFLKTVHDRVSLEIARGCTRGCRFCQAGYIYRPVRERNPERLLTLVEETLRATGYDEISLLSLSTGDYGCITPLLKALMDRYAAERVAVSLPSLRVGSLTPEMAEEIRKVRKTGFTLAPEAGSERLRLVINKGIAEADLLEGARSVYAAGWRLIKLYFMIGLPTETMADLLGIADLAKKVKQQGKGLGGGEVNVAVSSFVPKPHTPFQWEPQISYEEILEKQQFLRRELRTRKLKFKWQDAPLSVMEGVFARGDRRLGRVLVEARRLGCRFDGWGEHFNFAAWQQAFAAVGIDPLFYHRRREYDELLPWDHLDCGVSREFLREERQKAAVGEYTPDCRTGACTGCGVCDFDQLKMRLHTLEDVGLPPLPTQRQNEDAELIERIRLRFTKTGRMRFLSHLEQLTLFTRAIGRARVPIRYSQGFHPHPKFSFATALSVGVESLAEYMDMEIAAGFGAQLLQEKLNEVLPAGISIVEAAVIPLKAPSLSVIMEKVRYRVTLPEQIKLDLPALAQQFLALESLPLRREKKGKVVELDLRQELSELTVTGNCLEMVIGRGKPLEFTTAITDLAAAELGEVKIEKLEVIFSSNAG
jgi:radical SAM family uncharacterized protein/radical SAM-linked protein